MEAINIHLPAETPDALKIVRVWGERRLQGFADTGVFSISTGERQSADAKPKTDRNAADETQAGRYDDDGLDSTIIEFEGRLDVTSHDGDHGVDPYNRYDCSTRATSL